MTEGALVGRTIGDYQIVRRLDRHSNAVVYLAEDRKLHREVEFKVLDGVDARNQAFAARFRQGAAALAELEHPGLARTVDFGSDGALAYLITEHYSQGTLADRLARAGPGQALAADYAATVGTQIAEALAFAHQHGVVHGGITPDTLLLTSHDRLVLADLGVAKLLERFRPNATTPTLYAAQYVAPEQGLGKPADARSDLYALGVVLYEMLTGKPPYQADTPSGIIDQHNNEPLVPIRRTNPRVPATLALVVQKSLAKAPQDRYQSADEMVTALRSGTLGPLSLAESGEGFAAASMPDWTASLLPPETPPRRYSRSGLWIVLAALALTVAIVLGAFATSRSKLLPGEAGSTVAQSEQGPVPPSDQPAADQLAAAGSPAATLAPAPPTAEESTATPVAAVQPPTVTATPEPPTATATPEPPTATATSKPPTATATPEPPTATASSKPPTATATSRPPTATARPTLSRPTATTSPGASRATAPPVRSELVLDFEQWGAWRRGNEPYGTLSQARDTVAEGKAAARLAYDIPAVDNNYVVFLRQPPAPIPGKPDTLTAQVYGDGSGLFLNAWIRDSQGEVRQFSFGRILHRGAWQPMVLTLDPAAAWPQGHISGPDNGKLDYPISLYALVLDAEGSPAVSGQIAIDDLVVGGPAAPTPGPAIAATPLLALIDTITPSSLPPTALAPTPGATPALAGRIVYPAASSGATNLMGVDVGTGNIWLAAPNARQPDALGEWVLANGTGGNRNDVFIVSIAGGGERLTGLHPEDSYPSWSPTGEKALFSSTISDGLERIYLQENMAQRQEPVLVQIGDADLFGRNPTWIDDVEFAFSGCNYWAEGSKCGIWVAACNDCVVPVQLTEQVSDVTTEVRGGRVLYHSQRTGNWDVYDLPVAGGASRNLTHSPSQDAGAVFSPDGRSIAFMSDRDGTWGIWVMDADGANPRKLIAVPEGFGVDFANDRLAWGP